MGSQAESSFPPAYDFAEYRLEPARRSLTRTDGTALNIAGKPFDVLLYLVQHAGEVVDRSALMRAVWPKRVVEDNNVNQIIAGLRRTLGPQHIVTVAGRGYQFVTPVRTVVREIGGPVLEPAPASPAKRTTSRASKQVRYGVAAVLAFTVALAVVWYLAEPRSDGARIAVLPCEDLSPDPSSSYFATGIHDELLNRLAQIRSLRVISRSSVLRYAVDRPPNSKIAAELGVDSIMECGVRYAGEEVVLSVRLIDAASDEHVWSQSYSADMGDLRSVYAIQASVAIDVATALRVEVLNEDPEQIARLPTESREAYEDYLAALGTSDRERQLELLDRAVTLDPAFVEAWIARASMHMLMEGRKIGEESAAHGAAALDSVHRALELDPDSARAHAALAVYLGQKGEWIESEQEWQRATALARGASIGGNALQELAVGHVADAVAAMEAELLTNPMNQGTRSLLLIAYETLGDKAERRRHWERGEVLFSGSWMGHFTEPGLRLAEKDRAFVTAHPPRHPGAMPIWSAGVEYFDSPENGLAALRSIYADPKMRSADLLRELTTWALHFGDPALALLWFREAVDLQATSMLNVWLPLFAPLRAEPGFKDLVRDQGMPEYWNRFGWPTTFCRPTEGDDFECR